MTNDNDISDYAYTHINDWTFKSILLGRANGLLRFVKIPYRITRIMMSEFTNVGPNISRVDFAGEAEGMGKTISLIIECQTKLPTDEDVKRFFQYVSSIRLFKNRNVELYILCTEKPGYTKREFVLNDNCVYTMHVISLKDFKAKEIFKSIEDKLKNNEKITDGDIAALQLIVYTDYDESKLEILNKARKLFEVISERMEFDINEKSAIIYLFNVLSANMLDECEYSQYVEENKMLLNPVEREMRRKGIEEGIEKGIEKGIKEGIEMGKLEAAINMLKEGIPLDKIVKITGLPSEVILNAR